MPREFKAVILSDQDFIDRGIDPATVSDETFNKIAQALEYQLVLEEKGNYLPDILGDYNIRSSMYTK